MMKLHLGSAGWSYGAVAAYSTGVDDPLQPEHLGPSGVWGDAPMTAISEAEAAFREAGAKATAV